MAKSKALITGIAGQDGSYLAELLLAKNYEVHGVVRKEALEDPINRMWRLQGIIDDLHLHAVSIESESAVNQLVDAVQPIECYHLAAKSFVSYSFDDDFDIISTNVKSTHYLLSAIKRRTPDCHIYFAGSSEMFGRSQESPQNESTVFHPRSPYGISKLAGYHLLTNYREQYDLFASCGILFNHESPRRGYEFVSRKISFNVARIKLGLQEKLKLGNLDARRDWGHAREYVEAMWLMLQQDQPTDFVIGTGETHSVRELLRLAFLCVDLNYEDHVELDKRFYRSSEEVVLVADATKARTLLGWKPKVSFDEMIGEMVMYDLRMLSSKGPT